MFITKILEKRDNIIKGKESRIYGVTEGASEI